MKIFFCILFTLVYSKSHAQLLQTLNTSNQSDLYSDTEINALMQINFLRTLNKLRPLKTNPTLNHFSKTICKKLQDKSTDTVIKNTLIVFFNDSLKFNHPLLKDTFHLIGIHHLPHRFNCEIMVITLDRKMEQIKWKDLDCPDFLKPKNKLINKKTF